MSSVVISGDTSGAITLSAPAVSGTNTATLPAATGTVMVSGNMPAFSAYKSSNQTGITPATYTKITFDTELFDTNNNFASSRFTPTVAGYYQINAGLNIAASGDSLCVLYKNGTVYQWGGYIGGGQGLGIGISSLVYMNGSTDYVEIYIYTGGTSVYGNSGYFTWFNGSLVRSA
jgi:hypothetical protein